jgi:phosphate transport system substrate-binding protein
MGEQRPDADAESRFAREAAGTGLALPPAHKPRLLLAILLVAVLVAASIGIGQWTGWAVGPRSGGGVSGLLGRQDCSGVPAALDVYLPASVSARAGASLPLDLGTWGAEFANWSGECVHVESSPSAGDGYVPELSSEAAVVAASDLLPNATDLGSLGHAVEVVPGAVAPIAIAYDLPGLAGPLRLNGATIAGLFAGNLTAWNSTAIADLNPGVDLDGLPPVTVVHRSDPSGATLGLTGYLSDVDPTWNSTIGAGPSVTWPGGVPVDGPVAMAETLSSTPGAVGYLETNGSSPANVSLALVADGGGFAAPQPANATSAAAAEEGSAAVRNASWAAVSLAGASGGGSYPIDALVYFTVYEDLGVAYAGALGPSNASWLLTFLWWLAIDAGADTAAVGLGALPSGFATPIETTLEKVLFNGVPLLVDSEGGEGGETGEF